MLWFNAPPTTTPVQNITIGVPVIQQRDDAITKMGAHAIYSPAMMKDNAIAVNSNRYDNVVGGWRDKLHTCPDNLPSSCPTHRYPLVLQTTAHVPSTASSKAGKEKPEVQPETTYSGFGTAGR